jgi:hypothetical protein
MRKGRQIKIDARLTEGENSRIQPSDFHPHWHWYKSLFPALSQLVQNLQFSTQKHDKDAELKRQIDERMNGNMQLFDELQLVEYWASMSRYNPPCATALHVLNGATIEQLVEVVGRQITLEIHAQTFPILDEPLALLSLNNACNTFTIKAKIQCNQASL